MLLIWCVWWWFERAYLNDVHSMTQSIDFFLFQFSPPSATPVRTSTVQYDVIESVNFAQVLSLAGIVGMGSGGGRFKAMAM